MILTCSRNYLPTTKMKQVCWLVCRVILKQTYIKLKTSNTEIVLKEERQKNFYGFLAKSEMYPEVNVHPFYQDSKMKCEIKLIFQIIVSVGYGM